MSDQDDLKKLIHRSTRRLQQLKEQRALKGIDTEPHIIIEIEDLEVEIANLQTQLQQLIESSAQSSPAKIEPTRLTADSTRGSKIPRIFFSYAQEDKAIRDKLAVHLKVLQRQGKITTWYDGEIVAGSEWEKQLYEQLNSADIILLLISPDFIASDFAYDFEMKRALERHDTGEAVVIPIILRPIDLTDLPFSKLTYIPRVKREPKPITTWPDADEAFLEVVKHIVTVVDQMKAKS
jgi:hypothetical protein